MLGNAGPSRALAATLSRTDEAYRDASRARLFRAYANALLLEGESARAASIYDRLAEAAAMQYDLDELRYARILAAELPSGSAERLDMLRAFVADADNPVGHRVFTARLRLAQAELRAGDADGGRADLEAIRADLAALLSDPERFDPGRGPPAHPMLINAFAEVSTDLASLEIGGARPDIALLLLDELDAIAPNHGVEHNLRELAEEAVRRAAC